MNKQLKFLKPLTTQFQFFSLGVIAIFSLIACSGGGNSNTNGYTIGGNVNGLGPGKNFIVANGTNTLNINNNGPFTFSGTVSSGQTYNVTIGYPLPNGFNCYIQNGTGTVSTNNVTNINIDCNSP